MVAMFLGLDPTPEQLAAAAATYDPALRRSAARALEAWPPEHHVAGLAADAIYGALRTLDAARLAVAAEAARELARYDHIEAVRWYDPSLGWMTNPVMARRAAAEPDYAAQLRATVWPAIRAGAQPQTCPSYRSWPGAPRYSIQRPPDLGPWSATFCQYRGAVMTREAAYGLHQTLYTLGEAEPPDRHLVRRWAWSFHQRPQEARPCP
jgi:hypothetical protein